MLLYATMQCRISLRLSAHSFIQPHKVSKCFHIRSLLAVCFNSRVSVRGAFSRREPLYCVPTFSWPPVRVKASPAVALVSCAWVEASCMPAT